MMKRLKQYSVYRLWTTMMRKYSNHFTCTGAQNTWLTLGAKGMYSMIDYWFCSAPTVDLRAPPGDALAAFLSQWLSTEKWSCSLSLASATD